MYISKDPIAVALALRRTKDYTNCSIVSISSSRIIRTANSTLSLSLSVESRRVNSEVRASAGTWKAARG